MGSVSYTHLDVYKRQVPNSALKGKGRGQDNSHSHLHAYYDVTFRRHNLSLTKKFPHTKKYSLLRQANFCAYALTSIQVQQIFEARI